MTPVLMFVGLSITIKSSLRVRRHLEFQEIYIHVRDALLHILILNIYSIYFFKMLAWESFLALGDFFII